MRPDYVFLLGRPGSGKSTVFRLLEKKLKEKNIEAIRVDDFLTLKEILSEDKEFKRHILKNGGFEVTDWSVVDEALQKLNQYIKEIKKPNNIIFIEFARDNYLHALSNFDNDVLSKAIILYTLCPYEECCRRNIERFKKIEKTGHDNHIVPIDLMELYYKSDDIEEMIHTNLIWKLPIKLVVVDSSRPGTTALEPQVNEFIEKFTIR